MVIGLKRKIIGLLLLAGLLVIATACGTVSNSGGVNNSKGVSFGDEEYKQIIAPNNALGFKLLPEIEADENGNTFISPTSLFMALSMLYNGADGMTKEEIAEVLEIEGLAVEALNGANASLLSMLQKESNHIQLDVANSIWINEKFHFQEAFAQNNENYFQAAIEEIELSDDSVDMINNWVKNATHGKIKDIVEAPLNPDLVAFLINAIYFKGDWLYEFNEEETEDADFSLTDGTTKKVPLMALREELAYMENDAFQAVKLPYGDGEMNMQVFLPKEDSDLAAFQKTITAENWLAWQESFETREGTVYLPKFQLDYEIELNDVLLELGMTSAFDKTANLSKMIQEPNPILVSEVRQKTFLEVNEKGTEAAAATVIEVVEESASITEELPFHMEVNRPFFIMITDEETGMILFMGTIENPQE